MVVKCNEHDMEFPDRKAWFKHIKEEHMKPKYMTTETIVAPEDKKEEVVCEDRIEEEVCEEGKELVIVCPNCGCGEEALEGKVMEYEGMIRYRCKVCGEFFQIHHPTGAYFGVRRKSNGNRK